MTQIDQFESAFNAAAKERFRYERVEVGSVLVMTDLEPAAAEDYVESVKKYLDVLGDVRWEHVRTSELDIAECVGVLKDKAPDLLVSYRNLNNPHALPVRSLGDYLDVLLQQTSPPVLVTPHPQHDAKYEWAGINTDAVMVVTDHLAGDHRLVNWGARFTEKGGKLYLTHLEDDLVFERYIGVIGKIPTLDTDLAREEILQQLLKEPHDWIRSAREEVEAQQLGVEIVEVVQIGHQTADYKRLVEQHSIDLLVFYTEDEGQVAMHGVAYGLACELDRVPLLML
jgi:hypothetical protein